MFKKISLDSSVSEYQINNKIMEEKKSSFIPQKYRIFVWANILAVVLGILVFNQANELSEEVQSYVQKKEVNGYTISHEGTQDALKSPDGKVIYQADKIVFVDQDLACAKNASDKEPVCIDMEGKTVGITDARVVAAKSTIFVSDARKSSFAWTEFITLIVIVNIITFFIYKWKAKRRN